jgi:predicted Zn-dependent protease
MKRYHLALAISTCLFAGIPPSHAEPSLEMPRIPTENLPDFGDPASAAMSTTEEKLLGQKLLRELRGSEPVIEDPELAEWIQNLGRQLSSRAPGNKQYYFVVVKDPEINAYAMPGGVIVVNSGLILNTKSEAELAAVLAHEVAHVAQRHIARRMADPANKPWIAGLGVLAGAAAASKSPDASEAIITSSIAAQAHKMLSFSRQEEAEADRVGLQILASAGFDPMAMADFMEMLDRRPKGELSGNITKYLQTHPLSIDRVSDTRSRANQMPRGRTSDSPEYRYARDKLRALLRAGPSPRGSAAGGNSDLLSRAAAYNRAGHYTETEKLLMPQVHGGATPESILTPLAEALLANGKAAQAWQIISQHPLTEQTSLEFLEVRQRVAQLAGQDAEAYASAAERSLRMGEYAHARSSLEQASRLPGIPAATAARLAAMAQEAKRLESQSKRLDKRF